MIVALGMMAALVLIVADCCEATFLRSGHLLGRRSLGHHPIHSSLQFAAYGHPLHRASLRSVFSLVSFQGAGIIGLNSRN
jgi:hypothetical protein